MHRKSKEKEISSDAEIQIQTHVNASDFCFNIKKAYNDESYTNKKSIP